MAMFAGAAYSAASVRVGSNNVRNASAGVTSAARNATTASTVRAGTVSSARNAAVSSGARVSASQFLGSRGKLNAGVAAGSSGGSVAGGGNISLIELDGLASRIDTLENRVDDISDRTLSDINNIYTKDEIDSMISGAVGDKGDKGDEGLSAYEIAVRGGFTGTVDEWLASLKGDRGEPGSIAGATCTIGGDGIYLINVNSGIENCMSVSITGNVFTEQ